MASIEETHGGFLISQIKQVSGRVFERLLKEYGVEDFNGAQGRILYVLWQRNDIPIRELAEATGLAKTTLTGMLDRMEKLGLISRVLDANDRRLVRIVLMEKALPLKSQYQNISRDMSKLFYKGFTPTEIQDFELQLKRILTNLMMEES